jgi:hypothetical protein
VLWRVRDQHRRRAAQFLDARHRTQAHVEDDNKDLKACGGANLPSKDYQRNSAWLQLAALAVTLLAWLRHSTLDGDLSKASPKTLRYRLFAVPARLVTTPSTHPQDRRDLALGPRPHQRMDPPAHPAPRLTSYCRVGAAQGSSAAAATRST